MINVNDFLNINDFIENKTLEKYKEKINKKYYSEKIREQYELLDVEKVFNMDELNNTRSHVLDKCENLFLKSRSEYNHMFSESLLGHMEYTIGFFYEFQKTYEIVNKLLYIIFDMKSTKDLSLDENEKNLFKEDFKNILANFVYYHDFGKASLNFNKYTMKIEEISKDFSIKQDHSISIVKFASSYLSQFINKIEDYRYEFKEFYSYFIYSIVDMIGRHHLRDLSRKELLYESIFTTEEINEASSLYKREGYSSFINNDFLNEDKELNNFIKLKNIEKNHFKKIDDKDLDNLLLFKKLLHSLITCCDGFATHLFENLDKAIYNELIGIKEKNKIEIELSFNKIKRSNINIRALSELMDKKDRFIKLFLISNQIDTNSDEANKIKTEINYEYMNELLDKNYLITFANEDLIDTFIKKDIIKSNKMIFLIDSLVIIDKDLYEDNKNYLDLLSNQKILNCTMRTI